MSHSLMLHTKRRDRDQSALAMSPTDWSFRKYPEVVGSRQPIYQTALHACAHAECDANRANPSRGGLVMPSATHGWQVRALQHRDRRERRHTA
jgi:hypothetical protein